MLLKIEENLKIEVWRTRFNVRKYIDIKTDSDEI